MKTAIQKKDPATFLTHLRYSVLRLIHDSAVAYLWCRVSKNVPRCFMFVVNWVLVSERKKFPVVINWLFCEHFSLYASFAEVNYINLTVMMYNKCDETYILSEFLLYSVVFPQIIFVYDIFQNIIISQNYYKTHFLSSEIKLDFSYKFHFEILLFEIRYGYQKTKIYN